MTTLDFALVAIVAFAFTIETALGFGATLIAVSLGALIVPIDQLLPAFIPINLVLSAYVAVRYFSQANLSFLFRRVLPLMALGLPVGMWAFSRLDPRWLKFAFGVFVAVLSVVELSRLGRASPAAVEVAPSTHTRVARLQEGFFLFLGGVVHGAFATGGPMVVYVAGREIVDKAVFRSTLSVLWFSLNLILLASYALGHKFNATTGRFSLFFAMALVAGVALGEWAHRRFSAQTFRKFVFILLFLGGTILAVRAL